MYAEGHKFKKIGGVMKANKEKFECQECGKVFLKVIPKSLEVKCPKCGSYDTDLYFPCNAKGGNW